MGVVSDGSGPRGGLGQLGLHRRDISEQAVLRERRGDLHKDAHESKTDGVDVQSNVDYVCILQPKPEHYKG